MSTNDLDLGRRWMTRRDAGAFQALVARHAGMVYGTCRRVLGNATEAEDVAQECFEILARTPKWPEGSLGAWLHRVATNRSLNRLKSERRRVEREERYVRERAPQAESDWDDIYRHVDEAVAALPDKYRIPLTACFFESQSHATVAETLGIPRRTVTYRIDKGVERVRETLRKRGVPVAFASLVAMLGANLAEAAPASLTASLGRIALAGVKATEAAAAASATGGLLPNWLAVGGALAMWQKLGVGALVAVLLLLGGLWWRGVEPSARSVAHQESNRTEVARIDKPVARPVSRQEAAAAARSAVQAMFATERKQDTPGLPASVRGIVIDESGKPVAGALVRVVVTEDASGFKLLGTYKSGTDAEGGFLIENIRSFGHSTIYANHADYLQASQGVTLERGSVRDGLQLVMKGAAYTVSGWVVDASRRPVEDAEVALRHYKLKWPANGSFFSGTAKLSSTYTDVKGWFVIGVPYRADCDFTVLKEGFGAGFFMDISTGTDDALFVLKPGGGITGKVTKQDGTPVPNARVTAMGRASLGGENEDVMPAQTCEVAASTNADGYYLIDGLGADYTYTVNLDRSSVSGFAAAPIHGVKVAPARTTRDIDFTLHSLETVRLHGTVTDRGSGKPAFPISVQADVVNPEDGYAGDTSQSAITAEDGTYSIELHVPHAVGLRVRWRYTDGANVYPKNHYEGIPPRALPGERGVEVTRFNEVRPGEDETLDFTVDAGIRVPVRFVDPAGSPMPNLELAVRQDQASWGSDVRTGSDGRAVHQGLCPNTAYQIQAVATEPERTTVGESEPFAGKPGETLPEITVVCRVRGRVEGVLVDASGQPVANTEIGCTAIRDDGTTVAPSTLTTGDTGTFVLFPGLPEDHYQTVAVGYERNGKIEVGLVQDVEIAAGAAVDLGTVRCEPMISVEEAMQAAQAMEDAE